MKELFIKGGPLMWPLLICSIVSVTITIERIFFWIKQKRISNQNRIQEIFKCTENAEFDKVASMNKDILDIEAYVLVSGINDREIGFVENMELAAEESIDKTKQGLNILDTIITMAPLLGILGTVLGIIESFNLLGASGIEDPKAVTGGIAQALITTAAGLTVALMTLLPYNYFVSKVQKMTKHLEKLTTRFEMSYKKGMANNDETK